jgi:hypothetical protein
MATQVRVSNTTHELRRRKFLEGLNEDFKTLKEDSEAWQEELDERKMWYKTLLDGEEK